LISYWIDSTKNTKYLNSLNEDLTTDVCIIGAGIFGLTTAYYLSKKGFNVVVIDKDNIGKKASGYTTAKITSQHGLIYNYLINSFGIDFAKKYLMANQEAITNIKNIIDNENIDCDFEYQSSFVYTNNQDELSNIKKEIESVNLLGFDAKFVDNIDLPIKNLGAIEFPNQAQFHPRKYMLGLCDSIIKNNGKIFVNTTAVNVEKNNNSYITFTNNHKINSKYVVLACHYPFINIPGFYFTKMYQDTSYVIGVKTKSKLFDGMYINSEFPKFSFRTAKYNNDRILLFGGLGHKTGQGTDFNSSYGILEKEVKKIYPDSEILYRWNTRDCITLDKVPYIGIFSALMPNMYIGTGFNKWGMTTSNVAANIICDSISGIDNKYADIFSSTRMSPIKNRWEMKNILKESSYSLLINKLKIAPDKFDNIKNDSGGIIEIDDYKVGVYKNSDGEIFAVKPVCTHLGCLLAWNNLDKTWDCPCHGSRFDYTGKNIYDPAFKNLDIFDINT
jgi:glycine/D-amino acid oxidase-like deaminating enzyme/nitrite reductase/ring-hydroxylating ferredoxin subunit